MVVCIEIYIVCDIREWVFVVVFDVVFEVFFFCLIWNKNDLCIFFELVILFKYF